MGPSLVTKLIQFCQLFTIKDRRSKVRFQLTHNQGLRQLFLGNVLVIYLFFLFYKKTEENVLRSKWSNLEKPL